MTIFWLKNGFKLQTVNNGRSFQQYFLCHRIFFVAATICEPPKILFYGNKYCIKATMQSPLHIIYAVCFPPGEWLEMLRACFPFPPHLSGRAEYLSLFKIRSIDVSVWTRMHTGGKGWDYNWFDQIEHFSVLLDVDSCVKVTMYKI